ncbi:hypothetical protein FV219_00725 [Methylobacterium sp. WL122]|nr:hypothetical protein FV219_00725 [Methylobacterium sp. WL122]
MSRVEIAVPRLGEGIEEVRLVQFLVGLNHAVAKDQPLAEVETDKATLIIESTEAGTIKELLCQPGDVVHIGTTMIVIATGEEQPLARERDCKANRPAEHPSSVIIGRRHQVRTGQRRRSNLSLTEGEEGDIRGEVQASKYVLTPRQGVIARLLHESLSVPHATIEMQLDWSSVDELRRSMSTHIKPSGLELVAWATVRNMTAHPHFRALRSRQGEYHISPEANLGIAVALPEGELATVPLLAAEALNLPTLVSDMRAAISNIDGVVSASNVSLIISDMSTFGVTGAMPAVVVPSVATLFIGAPEWRPDRGDKDEIAWRRSCRLVLGFDHALINGATAAHFLSDIIDLLSNGVPHFDESSEAVK